MLEISLLTLIFLPIIAGLIVLTPVFSDNQVFIRRFSVYFAIIHTIFSLMFCSVAESSSTELACSVAPWLKACAPLATWSAPADT